MVYLLGLDIGTSSVKSVIFSSQGEVISSASENYKVDIPAFGYSEQDPDLIWSHTAKAVKSSIQKADISPRDIKGIGLSGQMHGLVALDKNLKPIRKMVLHNDVRSSKQVREIAAIFGDEFSDITYNPAFPGFQFVSLMWLKENEAENYSKIHKIICPKDYIRLKLTDKLGAEATDASGTLCYNMKKQNWSESLFQKAGLDISVLPKEINLPFDTAGEITKLASEEAGLAIGTTVVYGGADQAMHSLGNGVYKKGVMTVTIGTSGQVLMVTDNPVINPQNNTHTFRHVMPNNWYALGAILSAGSNLSWFKNNFAPDISFKELDKEAEKIPPGSDGLVFFPCMMGERTPYMDANTRGMFFGITPAHTRAHFARAVMEGVAFALKSCIDTLENIYPKADKTICAGGGGASSLWRQIQSDIYNRAVYVSKTDEQACTGAAIVAGVGTGIFTSLEDGCQKLVTISDTPTKPIKENTKTYDHFYNNIYLKLYSSNKHLF